MTLLQGGMRSKHVRIDRSSVEPIKVNTHPVACNPAQKGPHHRKASNLQSPLHVDFYWDVPFFASARARSAASLAD